MIRIPPAEPINKREIDAAFRKGADRMSLCGPLIGAGQFRDVYVLKGDPHYVVKVERDMKKAVFANATEWRHWIDNRGWPWLAEWLAPCLCITHDSSFLIQMRVAQDRMRKEYPKKIPSVFTDTKLSNFGWIDERFVCCDYSFFVLCQKIKLQSARWKGSIKDLQKLKPKT